MDNGFTDIPPIEEAQAGKNNNRTLIIVIVVVLVVLCCCCLVTAGGLWYFGDALLQALEDFTWFPVFVTSI